MSESIQLYLNSKYADSYNNNSISDCNFQLPNIDIQEGFYLYISLQNAIIPYSFYNVNEYNNTLIYTINSVQTTITITEGNYNVNSLIDAITALIPTLTITYSSITNKFSFSSTNTIILNGSSSCMNLLGFPVSSTTYTLPITSTQCINLNSITNINVITNLITYNISKSFDNNNSILACISINKPPYSLIEYNNLNNYKCNLFVNNISSISIKLVDNNNNLINLNNCHFTMTLQLDVIAFQ